MAPGKFLIYALVDPRTGEIRYIGKSTSGLKRPKAHTAPSQLAKDKTHKGSWLKNLLAAGLSPRVQVLSECESADLNDAEVYWIAWGRYQGWDLCNHADGGEGPTGCSRSPELRAQVSQKLKGITRSAETRVKMSAGHMGIANFLGKEHSAETKAQISAAKMGHSVSEETRRKISNAKRGVPVPDERKARTSASMKGRPKSPETVARMRAAQQARREAERRTTPAI